MNNPFRKLIIDNYFIAMNGPFKARKDIATGTIKLQDSPDNKPKMHVQKHIQNTIFL